MLCSEPSGVFLGRVFVPGPGVCDRAVSLSLGDEVGVHREDNSGRKWSVVPRGQLAKHL